MSEPATPTSAACSPTTTKLCRKPRMPGKPPSRAATFTFVTPCRGVRSRRTCNRRECRGKRRTSHDRSRFSDRSVQHVTLLNQCSPRNTLIPGEATDVTEYTDQNNLIVRAIRVIRGRRTRGAPGKATDFTEYADQTICRPCHPCDPRLVSSSVLSSLLYTSDAAVERSSVD